MFGSPKTRLNVAKRVQPSRTNVGLEDWKASIQLDSEGRWVIWFVYPVKVGI
jgi:hypothetical protein